MSASSCPECGDDLQPERVRLGFKVCLECQKEMEADGRFSKHSMEIFQSISGWQFEGVETVIKRKQ